MTSITNIAPDSLFLCSASFEMRCIHVPSLLPGGAYSAEEAIVLKFSGHHPRKEENCETIIEHLRKAHIGRVMQHTCDLDQPATFSAFVDALCDVRPSAQSITLDITTLTKQYLLLCLRKLRQRLPHCALRLLYTPGVYDRRAALSWGVRSIGVVPYLGGISAVDSRGSLLVLFLGYEGERAWAIWNHLEPDKTIAVIANPPTHEGDEGPSVSRNRKLIHECSTEVREVPALDATATAKLLSDLYNDPSYSEDMMYISPLGTKMQTVGVYVFFEAQHPVDRAQVLYASPVMYNEAKYTRAFEDRVIEYLLPPMAGKQGSVSRYLS